MHKNKAKLYCKRLLEDFKIGDKIRIDSNNTYEKYRRFHNAYSEIIAIYKNHLLIVFKIGNNKKIITINKKNTYKE